MTKKMNSYGKTWHVWRTGSGGQPGDRLPLGEPHLAWSFNRDGEAEPGWIEERDRRMGTNTSERRKQRQDLAGQAHPQSGVDDLNGKFSRPTHPIAGVTQAR
jgi:hypothetical protein